MTTAGEIAQESIEKYRREYREYRKQNGIKGGFLTQLSDYLYENSQGYNQYINGFIGREVRYEGINYKIVRIDFDFGFSPSCIFLLTDKPDPKHWIYEYTDSGAIIRFSDIDLEFI